MLLTPLRLVLVLQYITNSSFMVLGTLVRRHDKFCHTLTGASYKPMFIWWFMQHGCPVQIWQILIFLKHFQSHWCDEHNHPKISIFLYTSFDVFNFLWVNTNGLWIFNELLFYSPVLHLALRTSSAWIDVSLSVATIKWLNGLLPLPNILRSDFSTCSPSTSHSLPIVRLELAIPRL